MFLLLACQTQTLGTAVDAKTHAETEALHTSPRIRDYLGWDIATGDFDGDGVDDVAASAHGADSSAGAVVVFWDPLDDTTDQALVTASDRSTTDYFGYAIAGAGDLNADGSDDLLIGAYADDDRGSGSGSAYVFHGSISGLVEGVKLTASDGSSHDDFGFSLDGGGDVDGDGLPDVVVGAPDAPGAGSSDGAIYVFYGPTSAATEDKLHSPSTGTDDFGYAVANAGDVDADGYDDVLIGAPNADPLGTNSGAVYLARGSTSGASLDAAYAAAPSLAYMGRSVASAGDADGDGFGDVVVSAPFDHAGGVTDAGSVYIVYGSASGLLGRTEVAPSDSPSGYFGHRVAGFWDLDGDGLDDVLVGAPDWEHQGAVWVVYGTISGTPNTEKLVAGDPGENDWFGQGLAAADLEDDGDIDLAIGAPYADDTAASQGALHVFAPCDDDDDDGVCAEDDCDDDDDAVGVADTWYEDADGDGFGGASTDACEQPTDWIAIGGDCDDSDGAISPAATEVAGDGVDQDCDEQELCYRDDDADTYRGTATTASSDLTCTARYLAPASADEDCDDGDFRTHPGATERIGDEKDQDCDGTEICFRDGDGDGYTDGSWQLGDDVACDGPTELSWRGPDGDCDDADPSRHPGAAEIAGDEIDQDCDGREICFADLDQDGFTDGQTLESSDEVCMEAGEAHDGTPTGDCDDDDATRYPGADEVVSDEIDQDCDGGEICWADLDADGWIDEATVVSGDLDCHDGVEVASPRFGDCDDLDNSRHPEAEELVGDGIDSDCDGQEICHADLDEDGYTSGTLTSTDDDCLDATESMDASWHEDCDDTSAAIHPSADEQVADGVDQDCDGQELCFQDMDRDGHGTTFTVPSGNLDCDEPGERGRGDRLDDCDDQDPSIHPGATEVPNDGVDQDCDGTEPGPRPQAAEPVGCSSKPGAASVVGLFGLLLVSRRRQTRY